MAQLPYGLRALLAPRYDVSSFLLPGTEPVALPAILAASSRAPTTVVARPTTYGRTFTPIKPLTNAEIAALQERAVNMYTGSTRPATAKLTESGLGLQVPMFGGDGGDGVGNSSTGGPGPSASSVGSGIAQGIAAANSMGVLGAIADPMGALTAYAVHAALSPTLSAPEDAAPITSVSETSPGVGSGGASSAGMGGASVGSAGSTAATADSPDGPDGSNASAGGGGGDSGVGMGAGSTGEGVFKAGGYVNYAGGGMVNPAQQASGLAALGRGNDTMLVHMTPSEVQGLQAMAEQSGTSLTTNPYTGLPEAGKLEDRLRKVAPFLAFIPGVGTAAAALGAKVGLGALASQSIAAGLIGGFAAPGKGFNFSKGLQTGLLAYGLGSAYNAMNPNAPIGGPTGGVSGTGNVSVGGSSAVGGSGNVASPYGGVDVASSVGSDPIYGQAELLASSPPVSLAPPPATVATTTTAATDTATKVDPSKTKFEQFTGVSPTTALIGGNLAYGAYQADKEMDMYKDQAAALRAEEERKRALARQAFENSLGRVAQPTTVAKGGLIALARGGMPTFEYGGTTAQTGEPRMVKGAGDGMSDNVPASIEGVQEARLANDEFVIPADVVADIGNGSSSAGAKKLYSMMDRIRTARHGTTDQPPAIKAEKYMPA